MKTFLWVIGIIGGCAVLFIISIFFELSGGFENIFPNRTTLIRVPCAGEMGLEFAQTKYNMGIDAGISYGNTLYYVDDWSVRPIDSAPNGFGNNFLSSYKPEQFTWFAAIKNQTMGITEQRPVQYWNVSVSSYGKNKFSPAEYSSIASCLENNLEELNTVIGRVPELNPIGSIAYLPEAHSQDHRIPPYQYVDIFLCPTTERIVIENYAGQVSIMYPPPKGNYEFPVFFWSVPVGFINERGYFVKNIRESRDLERAEQTLTLAPQCLNKSGKNLSTSFEGWKNQHQKDFYVRTQ